MKPSIERLAERLSTSLGAEATTAEAAQCAEHKIDGVTPALICTPATADQLAAAVRICAESSAAIAPCGGGTAMSLGNPPRRYDVAIKTTGLNRLIEHDHANLTATVQSGMTRNALQAALAPQKQFIAIDPPIPERSTVGGIIAANLNGPRRSSYGSVRDLVIGMKVVLASGEIVKAGGKVVKNVAGYDMCKLFIGSLGTLGIVTEITLRVTPIPAHSAALIATGTLANAVECARRLVRTKLLPTAVYLLGSDATAPWRLIASFDGFAESVARQIHDLVDMAQQQGLTQEVMDGEKQQRYWQAIADLPVSPERLVYRITVPRGALLGTIPSFIDRTKNSIAPAICADIGMGTVWLVLPANQESVILYPHLIALAQQQRGHAVMFAAPAPLKNGIDIWGPSTPAHVLMGKIKQQFDPMGLLNPGRYIGGL
jgi:glycolate oxidase FAD binding subunit